ncbi:MAG TPA: NTP transferase domain-containing protein [Syntrophomonadaceae bacterium]|nr:NTP transferase domain-containing protein [Syntrophomonadaceae bacterium]
MTYAVIMAGGRGERFWPKSRKKYPKQFLPLISSKTMLQLTVGRVKKFVTPDKIFIITADNYQGIVYQQAPEVPRENIILEPFGRDTAAAIGLAAVIIQQRDPSGVMVVLPADHYISDQERFIEVLQAAEAAAAENHAVTIGIPASRPETGFGYLSQGELYKEHQGIPLYHVEKFIEKPNLAKAMEFLAKGCYFWNSGIFIWRADLIRRLIAEHLPVLAAGLEKIEKAIGTPTFPQLLKNVYEGLPKISIDYGVMEKTRGVLMAVGDFGWDDVGSWTALESYKKKDPNGNILEGQGVLVDTKNTMVQVSDKVVATLGVHDLIVVENEGSILICHKDKAQDLKKVITALNENGYKEIL